MSSQSSPTRPELEASISSLLHSVGVAIRSTVEEQIPAILRAGKLRRRRRRVLIGVTALVVLILPVTVGLSGGRPWPSLTGPAGPPSASASTSPAAPTPQAVRLEPRVAAYYLTQMTPGLTFDYFAGHPLKDPGGISVVTTGQRDTVDFRIQLQVVASPPPGSRSGYDRCDSAGPGTCRIEQNAGGELTLALQTINDDGSVSILIDHLTTSGTRVIISTDNINAPGAPPALTTEQLEKIVASTKWNPYQVASRQDSAAAAKIVVPWAER